jgi:hypothetical protein
VRQVVAALVPVALVPVLVAPVLVAAFLKGWRRQAGPKTVGQIAMP